MKERMVTNVVELETCLVEHDTLEEEIRNIFRKYSVVIANECVKDDAVYEIFLRVVNEEFHYKLPRTRLTYDIQETVSKMERDEIEVLVCEILMVKATPELKGEYFEKAKTLRKQIEYFRRQQAGY